MDLVWDCIGTKFSGLLWFIKRCNFLRGSVIDHKIRGYGNILVHRYAKLLQILYIKFSHGYDDVILLLKTILHVPFRYEK